MAGSRDEDGRDVLGADPRPRDPRQLGRRRLLVVAVLAAVVTGVVVTDLVACARERNRRTEVAGVRLSVTQAVPTGVGRPASLVQDARVALTVRNDGPSAVRVLDQRLDGGVPVDPGPGGALVPGASAVLVVRWRVRCAEIGGRFGPQSLDLGVRTRGGEVVRTRVALGEPLGELRGTFRDAAVQACDVLVP